MASKLEMTKIAETSILSTAQRMREKLAQVNEHSMIKFEITHLDDLVDKLVNTVSAQQRCISLKEENDLQLKTMQMFVIEALRSELQVFSRDFVALAKESNFLQIEFFEEISRVKKDLSLRAASLHEKTAIIHQFCIHIQEHCAFNQTLLHQVLSHFQVSNQTNFFK